jgi:hypothetical protein
VEEVAASVLFDVAVVLDLRLFHLPAQRGLRHHQHICGALSENVNEEGKSVREEGGSPEVVAPSAVPCMIFNATSVRTKPSRSSAVQPFRKLF